MGRWTAERWAASSGVVFVILLLVGNFVYGKPPKYNASAAKDVSWLMDKHKEIVIASILTGLAIVFFVWFLSSFAGAVRAAGEGRLATVMYGAGIVMVTLAAAGDAIGAALSRVVYFADPKTVQGLYATSAFMYERVWFGLLALSLATAIAAKRSNLFADWYVWLTYAGSVVFLLGALSLKTKGFFSVSGGMPLIAFLVFLAWILVSSALLVMQTAAEPMPAAATPSM
jgi:hypothetical protein